MFPRLWNAPPVTRSRAASKFSKLPFSASTTIKNCYKTLNVVITTAKSLNWAIGPACKWTLQSWLRNVTLFHLIGLLSTMSCFLQGYNEEPCYMVYVEFELLYRICRSMETGSCRVFLQLNCILNFYFSLSQIWPC